MGSAKKARKEKRGKRGRRLNMRMAQEHVFLLHAETDLFKKKVKKTRENIQTIFSSFRKPYVAYSGGKDSCVLLHLLLNFKKDIPVYHWDYGPYFIPRKLETLVIRNAFKMGAKQFIYATSEKYETSKRKKNHIWYKDFLGKELPRLTQHGFDLSFIGLRAEESYSRRYRTKSLISHDRYMANAFPLRNWTYKDVYAYLLKNNIPYPKKHYDKYSKLLGYKRSRFVTFHDPEFKQLSGALDGVLMYKHKNDDVEVK